MGGATFKVSGNVLINGNLKNATFEKIGDTTVDLTAYVQKVPTAIENNIPAFAADGALVDSNISAQVVKAHLENTEIHVTQEEKTAWNNKVSANEIPPIVEGVLMANIIEGNGLTVGEEGISLSIATETSAGAMSPEHVQKLNSVFAASTLTGALIGNEEAEINDDKKMIIPIGGEKLGVVKSTTVENGIAIAEDGTMSVNSISFSKIYTDDSEEIIFSGGGA